MLIAQIKAGDKSAFESVFKLYYSSLCAYAFNFISDTDTAEEIVQELFFQIWQKRDALNIQTSFKSYLFRSVHNSCLNAIKHKNIQQKHIEQTLHEQSKNAHEFSDALVVSELQAKIRRTIDKLPKERRKIFLMIRYDNLKYAQVAAQLNISVKNVENQMGSALRMMRDELKEYLPLLVLGINYLIFF